MSRRLVMDVPIVGAPLAGGPSTPALAAAVSEAGGLGFLAAGYKPVADVERELAEVRAATRRPFGVNVFVPARLPVDERAIEAYAWTLAGEAERYGAELGEPRWDDDGWEAKLALLVRERPAVVSFTFGCPEREIVEWLRECGCRVWCTVTSDDEARQAAAAGVDALVVQGAEAGGHQGSFVDHDRMPRPLLTLLDEVQRAAALPLIGAGGIATAADVAAVLAAGAFATQIGSALLLTSEAGTSTAHRHALTREAETRLTRAFTGRRARGIVNRFLLEHDTFAPRAYPELHYVTAPIRAAARALGDPGGVNLWAGTGYRQAREGSASELVERWASEL